MVDKKSLICGSITKMAQIYIISDDSPINFKHYKIPYSEDEWKHQLDQIFIFQKYTIDIMKILQGIDYLNLETLSIIEKMQKAEPNSTSLKKLNKEKLGSIFRCMGLNVIYCSQITEKIFIDLLQLAEFKIKDQDNDTLTSIKSSILVKQSVFYDISKNVIRTLTGAEFRFRKYFNLSYLIIKKVIPIIILLGGTSGTGKSTLSSLLASRLGISTVLSTDTIRHILRNFLVREKYPVLFSSTYEAWRSTKAECNQLSESKRVIKGYYDQCNLVGETLKKVVSNVIQRNESIIVEGVHLTLDNIKSILTMHQYTFPFLVYIEKADRHKERFAVRSKLMTLDSKCNKYVENFENIRTIQSYLIKKAEKFLLPMVDNTNVDKSLGMIHETILRSFKDIYLNNIQLYDQTNDKLSTHFHNFSKVSTNLLSSKEANILISQKLHKNFSNDKIFPEKGISSCTSVLAFNSQIFNINLVQINNENQMSINKQNMNNLQKDLLQIEHDLNLGRKVSATVKKECLSDDEVLVKSGIIETSEIKECSKKEIHSTINRINYQISNKGRRNPNSLTKDLSNKKRSMRALRAKVEMEEKADSLTNSIQRNGSIDSGSLCERVKVINETDDDDEANSYTKERENSYNSISEVDEKDIAEEK